MSEAVCQAIRDEIVAYVDGEVSEAERARIATHLGTCLSCRRELDRITKVGALLAALPAIEPSESFTRRMWDRLGAEGPARSQRRRWRPMYWAVPLAAAAAIAIAWYAMLAGGVPGGRLTTAPAKGSQVAKASGSGHAGAGSREATDHSSGVPRLAETEPQSADEQLPEDVPAELLARPELFLRLPVVRHLDELDHFEEVRARVVPEPLGALPGDAGMVGRG